MNIYVNPSMHANPKARLIPIPHLSHDKTVRSQSDVDVNNMKMNNNICNRCTPVLTAHEQQQHISNNKGELSHL